MEKFKTLFDFANKNRCSITIEPIMDQGLIRKYRAILEKEVTVPIIIPFTENTNFQFNRIAVIGRTSEEVLNVLDKFLCVLSNAKENPEADR